MKAIKGFENYLVSEDGRIWSAKSQRFMKPSPDGRGYLVTSLTRGGAKCGVYVHRLVAETYLPNPHNLPEVNHLDGNKSNNCVSNLEWCTTSGNQLHTYKLSPFRKVGSNHHFAKLNETLVEEIMLLKKAGATSKQLLEAYPVLTASTLSCVLNGHRWTHVTYKHGVTPRQWPRHLPFPEGVDTTNWKR